MAERFLSRVWKVLFNCCQYYCSISSSTTSSSSKSISVALCMEGEGGVSAKLGVLTTDLRLSIALCLVMKGYTLDLMGFTETHAY